MLKIDKFTNIKNKLVSIFTTNNSKSTDLELLVLPVEKHKLNWDFEVVSKNVFDNEGNEYLSVEDFHTFRTIEAYNQSTLFHNGYKWCVTNKSGVVSDWFDTKREAEEEKLNVEKEWLTANPASVFINDDVFDGEVLYRYGKKIDMDNARICGFGVVKMIKGEHQGKRFLFPVNNVEIALQIFAYGVLTYGKAEKKVLDIVSTPEGDEYLKLVIGKTAYEIVNKQLEIINR